MLSSNPNITWDIVKDNLDKAWNWYFVVQDKLGDLDRFSPKQLLKKEHEAADILKYKWHYL